MKTVSELMALPRDEACAYIDALTNKDKIALREAVIDWLVDELKFTIKYGMRKEKKNETS